MPKKPRSVFNTDQIIVNAKPQVQTLVKKRCEHLYVVK